MPPNDSATQTLAPIRVTAAPADAAGPPTADIVSNELAIAPVDQEDGVPLVVWRPRKNTDPAPLV